MPVIIVGSGRCGTSMVAGMLAHCGLYLGGAADLDDSSPNNAKGYWEHRTVRAITDRILQLVTEKYGAPGLAPQGWHDDPDLAPMYADAREFVKALSANGEPWGWKYPQSSLILPFWREIVPDLKVVLCVRNPLDVVSSLVAYGRFGTREGESIWLMNTMRTLLDTAPSERTVTFYEDYFPDFTTALFPVLDFVGLHRPKLGSELDKSLREFHQSDLKHHSSSLQELFHDSHTPYLVKELYVELLGGMKDASDVSLIKYADLFMPFVARSVAGDAADHERRHLKEILDSRTHRVASAICKLMIQSRPAKMTASVRRA